MKSKIFNAHLISVIFVTVADQIDLVKQGVKTKCYGCSCKNNTLYLYLGMFDLKESLFSLCFKSHYELECYLGCCNCAGCLMNFPHMGSCFLSQSPLFWTVSEYSKMMGLRDDLGLTKMLLTLPW